MTPENKIPKMLGIKAINYLPYLLIGFVLILFLVYLGDKLTLNERNCSTISNLYSSYPLIKNIDYDSSDFDYKLRDFYIKSAYNCCCSGSFKNDYVNVCALENALKNGARFLDFEIYSKNDMPIISASSNKDYSFKETYNDLAFKVAMEKIKDIAFSSICPNPEDPILLHFRIKSENGSICDVMANDIVHTFGQDILGKEYSNEFYGYNLGDVKLNKLKKKVIIIVDQSENIKFKSTKLYELVNMCSGGSSGYMRKYRNYDIEHSNDTPEIITYNKTKMSIVLPDNNSNNDNYLYTYAKEAGVQIIAMNFQNFDSNLKFYSLFFDSAGYAFVLKSEDMRADTITITPPETSTQLPPPSQSYGCPADDDCPSVTETGGGGDGGGGTESSNIVNHNENLVDKKYGKWIQNVNYGDILKKFTIPSVVTYILGNGGVGDDFLFKWKNGDESKITTTGGESKYYVEDCGDFDGILGINADNWDENEEFWNPVYKIDKLPNYREEGYGINDTVNADGKNLNEKIKSYNYDDFKNKNEANLKKYCERAVYKEGRNTLKKCTFKDISIKGTPNPSNKTGYIKSQKSMEGVLNMLFTGTRAAKEAKHDYREILGLRHCDLSGINLDTKIGCVEYNGSLHDDYKKSKSYKQCLDYKGGNWGVLTENKRKKITDKCEDAFQNQLKEMRKKKDHTWPFWKVHCQKS